MKEENQTAYLKGYKQGFEAAIKIAWAHAEDLLIVVDNNSKDHVQKYIDRLSA